MPFLWDWKSARLQWIQICSDYFFLFFPMPSRLKKEHLVGGHRRFADLEIFGRVNLPSLSEKLWEGKKSWRKKTALRDFLSYGRACRSSFFAAGVKGRFHGDLVGFFSLFSERSEVKSLSKADVSSSTTPFLDFNDYQMKTRPLASSDERPKVYNILHTPIHETTRLPDSMIRSGILYSLQATDH